MEVLLVIIPFLAVGIGVLFVAFAGGGSAARDLYLTRGRPFHVVSAKNRLRALVRSLKEP